MPYNIPNIAEPLVREIVASDIQITIISISGIYQDIEICFKAHTILPIIFRKKEKVSNLVYFL